MNPTSSRRYSAPIRWGMIGCGNVAEVKSGPGFQKADGSALAAVMRRNGALAADFARRHGVPRSYDNAEAVLADPQIDAVYIATPPGSHAEYACLAAAAGKPAYVEKPMARHTPECDRMVDAFARAGLPLFVAYYRRALPRFRAIKELLEKGAFGSIRTVSYRYGAPNHLADAGWRVAVNESGGGHLMDVGSHVIDLIDFFLGPLESVVGSAEYEPGPAEPGVALAARPGHSPFEFAPAGTRPGTVENKVSLRFRAGETIGTADWNFAAPDRIDLLTLAGDNGEMSFSVFGDEPLLVNLTGRKETLVLPNPPHVHQPLIQTVVDELLGRGKCPSTGESARRANQVMDKLLDSYYGGRTDPFWERPETWPK